MIIYKKVSREVDEPINIQCDKCKKEYNPEVTIEPQEFLKIDFIGGYNSVFGDGTRVQCDLCQHCLKELIGNIVRLDGEM